MLRPLRPSTIQNLPRTRATIRARVATPIPVVQAMWNPTWGIMPGLAVFNIRYDILARTRKVPVCHQTCVAGLMNMG